MFDIREELTKLPQKPGVYIMKDKADTIIYVGKAINLRNRVRQYFQSHSQQQSPKVAHMVAHITEFEYIVTDNELEALILECNLIKKHHPKYNIMLKDDKNYPYLKLTLDESFPRLFMTRKHIKDKAKYYGPYTSSTALKETVELAHRIWPLRSCQKKFPRDLGKGRPCLNYHIGRCKAPCAGNITEEQYSLLLNEVVEFLNGKQAAVIKRLEAEMTAFSESMEFEKAAEVRDTIAAVKILEEKQKIESGSDEDKDVIAMARAHDEALVQVFFIRGGKMTGREHFMLTGVDETPRENVMCEFIKQFYGETTFIPRELILETDIPDREVITKWLTELRGQGVIITVPQKAEKLKLVQLAAKNAIISLEQFGEQMRREQQRTIGALAEIQNALGLNIELKRIEAYDISNIQGYESVGSMVVFENGRPKRSDYRKFKIKEVIGANDVASMEEVIRRRFARHKSETEGNIEGGKFSAMPDALFIDGGKTQVAAAEAALEGFGVSVAVVGMIKDDRHRTRGMLYMNREISMPYTSEGFKLLTRIQDEVHRFAIEYHRKLREKEQIHSVLDDIPGIGPSRRKALMKHFGSIEEIRRAETDALLQAEGMNKRAAEAVYNFFRQ